MVATAVFFRPSRRLPAATSHRPNFVFGPATWMRRENRALVHAAYPAVRRYITESAQPGAKGRAREVWNAEDREHSEAAAKAFAGEYGTKWPKAAAKITDDLDVG